MGLCAKCTIFIVYFLKFLAHLMLFHIQCFLSMVHSETMHRGFTVQTLGDTL